MKSANGGLLYPHLVKSTPRLESRNPRRVSEPWRSRAKGPARPSEEEKSGVAVRHRNEISRGLGRRNSLWLCENSDLMGFYSDFIVIQWDVNGILMGFYSDSMGC